MLNDQSQQAHNFLAQSILARANVLIYELLENLPLHGVSLYDQPWYEDLFLQYQEKENSSEETEIREPLEFWIVSDNFAHKLKQENELLTNHWGFWIWGRETSGQSILIDYVFQKIFNDHKILREQNV